MKKLALVVVVLALAGCQRSPGEVTTKVLEDFGLKARPEGYVSTADKVFQKLGDVGNSELQRLNAEGRHGEVKFQEKGAGGQYYKEVKVYDKAAPLDARSITGAKTAGPAYVGYVEYTYQIMQSERKSTRIEAEAESANVPTGVNGRETYRYNFNGAGIWDGVKGEKGNS